MTATQKTDLLIRLNKDGTLNLLFEAGVITPTVFKAVEARLKISALEMQGVRRADAVKRVANYLGCHPKHVYTYLR